MVNDKNIWGADHLLYNICGLYGISESSTHEQFLFSSPRDMDLVF